MLKKLFLFFLTLGFTAASAQQIERFNPDTIQTIQLDSVVNIKASRLNVESFVQAIINDTSFYQVLYLR
jgi:hypothetical protein